MPLRWSQFREQRVRLEKLVPRTADVGELEQRVRRLEILLDVCSYLASSLDLHTTLERISEVTRDMLNAAEASIMVLNERTKTLEFEVVTGEKGRRLQGMEVKLGEGIAGQVAASGEARLIPDCSRDPAFARRFDEVSGFVTRSILCVPLVSQREIVGVLEALNKRTEDGCFDDDDLEIALGLAQVAAASVMNARLYKRLQEAQAEMVLAGKLAALGTIASGIAHELNQPLTGILGFVQLLLRQLKSGPLEGEKPAEQLAFVEKQAHRMARIINHIRTFAHPSPVERAPVSLNQVVEDARMLMNEQFASHGIRLELDLEPDLPKVHGDTVRLEEVIINLLANARDAVDAKGGGAVRVTTRRDGDQAVMRVQDNGTGIPDEVLVRIFDPFFTTKEEGKGTGLGLSLSHGIVRDHGGRIEVESQVGVGTTFSVTLPL